MFYFKQFAQHHKVHTTTTKWFSTFTSSSSRRSKTLSQLVGAGVFITGTTLLLHNHRVALADTPQIDDKMSDEGDPSTDATTYTWSDRPRVLACGSNKFGLIAPDQVELETIRVPRPIKGLDGRVLKDIAFAERHAAAIDAHGNLYQWGTGYMENSAAPVITLNGQHLVRVTLSDNKVYALREDGQVIVMAASFNQQEKDAATAASMEDRTKLSSSKDASGWLWGWWPYSAKAYKNNDAAQLMFVPFTTPDERIVALDAGDHHVVALSSNGAVYTCAADAAGNRFGQLGLGYTDTIVVPTDMVPKDPKNATNASAITLPISDASAFYQTKFAPIHQPDGVNSTLKAKQIACGSRHTVMLTDNAVYGWGWNGWGQLAQSEFDGNWRETESSPCQVKGSREFTSSTPREVVAGGNNTVFVMEREEGDDLGGKRGRWEVWACGMGQWGQLGNGTWTHMRGLPVLVKRLSNLREYSEKYGKSVGIKPAPLSLGRTHAAAILTSIKPDVPSATLSAKLTTKAADEVPLAVGSDVLTWGRNVEGQCANGKSNNICAPSNPPRSAELFGNPKVDRLQVERNGRTVKEDASNNPLGVSVQTCVKAQGDVTVLYDAPLQ